MNTPQSPIATIIVPAHNEASIIGRCLNTMLDDARPGEFDVIVATNGCTDDTAAIASMFSDVRVVDAPKASKSAALNAADSAADVWPRIYVDADVMVDTKALRETVTAITENKALAAAPKLHIETASSPWLVRAWYQIYQQIPWTQNSMIGSGFYALSKEGHNRLGAFPDVIYEDLVVARLFTPQERVTVTTSCFTLNAPRNFRTLLKIKTRVATGNLTYRRQPIANIQQYPVGRNSSQYWNIFKRLSQWPAIVVYVTTYGLTRMGARWRYRKGDLHTWTKDHTTRISTP